MRVNWLVLKLQRVELLLIAIVLVALTTAMLVITARLNEISAALVACPESSACEILFGDSAFFASLIPVFAFLAVGVAAFGGILLGVPAAAGEIERGTAPFTWTMSPSRQAWFLRRCVVMGAAVAILTIPPSIATDLMFGAAYPNIDIAQSFEGFEIRGPVIAARALAGFGIGTLAGALTGKQLSGLLVAVLGSVVLLGSVQVIHDGWLRAESVQLPDGSTGLHALVFEVHYLLPDGRVVDLGTALGALDGTGSHPADVFPARHLGIPSQFASEKRTREAMMILTVGFVTLAGATIAVRRRRPY